MRFAKAHGLGNDFILVEARLVPREVGAWARRLCDRHRGVGGDGILAYGVEGSGTGSGATMRLINADGSDGDLSGNGVRCVAAYLVSTGRLPERHTVQTPPGPRPVEVTSLGERRYRVRTDLGPAILASQEIPVALDPPQPRVVNHPLEAAGRTLEVTATSLGNPHCAVFLEAVADDTVLGSVGPALERHPFFPRRTNVEFVTVVSREELRVRFWERGVGPTEASGTGSASAAVAAVVSGRAGRRVRAVCDGGVLEIEWPEGGNVIQVGEVEVLFEGHWGGACPA